MSQNVTKDQGADLLATLTSQDDTPALSLAETDVSAAYRKEGQASFSNKSLSDTAGSVTSGNSETYSLSDGETLDVKVDGAAAQTATFNTGDFGDIADATAAEVAAVINTDVTGVTASDDSGSVKITSDSTGESSSVQVTGGTANSVLGFDTNVHSGRTIFKEIGSGVYTIEFLSTELDTVGSFTYKVTGSTINQFVGIANVVEADQVSTVQSLNTCIVSGHILDVRGEPVIGASVSARVLGFPTIISGIGVSDDTVSARTDKNGEFFLELVRLAEVDVRIPEINYRRQLTVPNKASATLFEIA